MMDGWMLPPEVFQWLEDNISHGSSILEFGSGTGSVLLSEKYELISVEHDEQWLGLSSGEYIHAPIVQNQASNKYSELGWYDFEMLKDLPSSVDVILIDGPPGEIGRSGILQFLQELPRCTWMIIDDTDRLPEKTLADIIIKQLSPKETHEIESQSPRFNGSSRKSRILKIGD